MTDRFFPATAMHARAIAEIFEAAHLLDRAAAAHTAGERDAARLS